MKWNSIEEEFKSTLEFKKFNICDLKSFLKIHIKVILRITFDFDRLTLKGKSAKSGDLEDFFFLHKLYFILLKI